MFKLNLRSHLLVCVLWTIHLFCVADVEPLAVNVLLRNVLPSLYSVCFLDLPLSVITPENQTPGPPRLLPPGSLTYSARLFSNGPGWRTGQEADSGPQLGQTLDVATRFLSLFLAAVQINVKETLRIFNVVAALASHSHLKPPLLLFLWPKLWQCLSI